MVLSTSQLDSIRSACGYKDKPIGSSLSSIIVRQINEFIVDSNEAAMFLAQLIHESDGFLCSKEIGGGVGQPYTPKYCGRGFIQLTWDYNYREASFALFGNDKLVSDPELVSNDPKLSMDVSVWFWKNKVHSIKGDWKKKFHMTTNKINSMENPKNAPGDKSLAAKYAAAAQRRYSFYKKAAAVLGVRNLASDAWE